MNKPEVAQSAANNHLASGWLPMLVALWVLASGQSFRLPHGLPYWGGLLYLSLFGSVIAFAAYFSVTALLHVHHVFILAKGRLRQATRIALLEIGVLMAARSANWRIPLSGLFSSGR